MVQDEKFGFRSEPYYYLIFNEHSHSVFAEARDVNFAFWNVSMSRLWFCPRVSSVGEEKHLPMFKECVTHWFESISYDTLPHSQNSHLHQVRISHTYWELSSKTHIRTSHRWGKDKIYRYPRAVSECPMKASSLVCNWQWHADKFDLLIKIQHYHWEHKIRGDLPLIH